MIKMKLHDICRPKQWKTLSTSVLLDDGYPVYGANGIIGFYSEYTHKEPTLMITCRGATCGSLHISKPYSYINGNAMALDNLDKSVDIKYLYFYLKYRGFNDVITGSAQPQITGQSLEKISLNIPSFSTQTQIAQILDKSTALIAKRKAQIAELDKLVQSVFLEMFGDPITNPKKWRMGKIKDVIVKSQYGTSAKASEIKGEYPILRMNNITYTGEMNYSDLKYIDLDEKDKTKYLVYKGELLFNRTNSKELVGKTGLYNRDFPMAFAGYLIKVSPDCNIVNSEFLVCYMNSQYVKTILFNMAKNIVGMANINAKEMENIEIYIPDIKLQTQFAQIAEKIHAQKSFLQKSLAELEVQHQALMQKAFNGQLVG